MITINSNSAVLFNFYLSEYHFRFLGIGNEIKSDFDLECTDEDYTHYIGEDECVYGKMVSHYSDLNEHELDFLADSMEINIIKWLGFNADDVDLWSQFGPYALENLLEHRNDIENSPEVGRVYKVDPNDPANKGRQIVEFKGEFYKFESLPF